MEKSVTKAGESHHRSRRTTVLMDMVKAARKTGNREGIFLIFFPTLRLEFAKSGTLRAPTALTPYLASMSHVSSYVTYFRDLCVKTGLICNLSENKCLKLSSVIKKKGMNCIEAVFRRCSVKKVFLEISQNSQENTCVRVSFLIKLQAAPATLLKKRL